MIEETPEQLRKAALSFGLEAYQKVKNNRAYALTDGGKVALGAFSRAMFLRRIEEGRAQMNATPTPWQEFFGIIEKIAAAGAPILQQRPGDAKRPPKPWLDPVTGEALPNPWRTKDLKAQTILQTRDPSLAEHYKAVAADPYGTMARYQDEEAARATMEQMPYGPVEHGINPFRTNDLKAQSVFIKNAPPGLVEFCKNEAQPAEIPLFGVSRNHTIEGRLARQPAMLALMKVAAQIRDTWRADDARAAEAKRAAVEDEIKRLEAA